MVSGTLTSAAYQRKLLAPLKCPYTQHSVVSISGLHTVRKTISDQNPVRCDNQ